ncbi:hypothetical protein SNOG_01252 [Parastagonospora nodorum SN15]|uniref:Rhodopsin domain-containing protein n=1 Tax=Phaeosphaeria nodorum (strain SN15 / ATCC MYA-4574 / FGSC 10173) TaxID=321614 RepID=Q0V412_PHANO|nr:hypothetical protein SNOG_01252 [Parastagonospora nodorum SN15]EAT90901.2 hypothetical protein SNOG_01252 [Parastagonospora nodorum SN15]
MLMATQSPTTVVVVTAVMLALDIIVVFLRVVARKQRRQPLKADDWFCFIALVSWPITMLTTNTANMYLRHSPLALQQHSSSLQYIFLVISVPALGAIKISVVCFYRRIFVVDKTNLRDFSNAMYIFVIALVSIWTGGFCLAFMFSCKGEFAAFWTSAISLITKCVNTLELFFAFAVSDFISDCFIIVLPIPMNGKLMGQILGLHLPVARKLGVLFVFLLGILATVASLIRMIWVTWARTVGFDVTLDQNRKLSLYMFRQGNLLTNLLLVLITTSLFWNMLEVSLGIIAACLPTLRGLAKAKSVDSLVNSDRDKISIRSGSASKKSKDSSGSTDGHRKDNSGQGTDFITVADHSAV